MDCIALRGARGFRPTSARYAGCPTVAFSRPVSTAALSGRHVHIFSKGVP